MRTGDELPLQSDRSTVTRLQAHYRCSVPTWFGQYFRHVTLSTYKMQMIMFMKTSAGAYQSFGKSPQVSSLKLERDGPDLSANAK
jgi:hypothetical protein